MSLVNKVNFTYRGLCAAVFTAFHDDLSVNIEIIPKYSQYLVEQGFDGILINGTTSEGMSMTVAERKLLAEEWVKTTKKTKQHLMVQIGGCPLPDVLNLAEHAEKIGVDSILCLPEIYFRPSKTTDLIKYLKLVAAAAPNTPFLYYNSPLVTHVQINPTEFLNELGDQIPNFAGIKFIGRELDAAADAAAYFKAKGKNCAVFMASNTVLAGAFSMGIDSAMPTTITIFPEYSKKIWQAVKDGNVKEASEIQRKLTDIYNVLTKEGHWIANMKVFMNLLTPIKVGKVRPPIYDLTEEQIENMKKSLEKLLK